MWKHSWPILEYHIDISLEKQSKTTNNLSVQPAGGQIDDLREAHFRRQFEKESSVKQNKIKHSSPPLLYGFVFLFILLQYISSS